MKKILITGGSGFVGTNLIKLIDYNKYKIFNIDKLGYASTPENFKNIKRNYFFKKINLLDSKQLSNFFQKFQFDYIIHLAAESHVDRSIDAPNEFIKENVNASTNLYNAILKNKKLLKKVKIIHVSTDEVYGDILNKDGADEKSIFNPKSPYSSSKAACEHIAKSFYYTFNMNIMIVRFCNIFGPYQFPEKFIPTIILNIFNKKKIPLYGSGNNIRQWIFVNDVCKLLITLTKKFSKGGDLNIGTDNLFKNVELINKISKKFDYNIQKRIKIQKIKDRPGHDLRYKLNSKRFSKTFKNFRFTNFDKGLAFTIQWYKNNQKWINITRKKYKGQRLGNY